MGELFCGPGGLAWGAINADIGNADFKIIHQWASDYDKDTCETYRKNICPNCKSTVFQEDIRNLDLKKLPKVDVLAFGFPCNDYSQVGKRLGKKGKFGSLFQFATESLKHFQPMWFIAENVLGLISLKKGNLYKEIKRQFRGAGYTLVSHVFRFEEYGIPQKRHRLIIVGIKKGLEINGRKIKYKVPDPASFQFQDNSCRFALESPKIPDGISNHEITKHSQKVRERLRRIAPGENAFTANLPEDLRLQIKGARLSFTYKKLDPDKPAYTVCGGGGGGSYMYHWEEPRALTNRERARLQTFPDDFVFVGNRTSVGKQIGMAVPCKASKIIFESVLKCFAGIDYPSVKASISKTKTKTTAKKR